MNTRIGGVIIALAVVAQISVLTYTAPTIWNMIQAVARTHSWM